MNRKAIQWLYRQLPELIKKGILSDYNAQEIRKYYGEENEGRPKNIALVICSILGALLIGLGIILLFAHNWENFSRFLRTVLSLLPLLGAQTLAGWVIFHKKESVALREGSAVFLALMVSSSLALVGQTYHIEEGIASYLLTWMLLTIPIVYLLRSTITGIIYVIGITGWTFSVIFNNVMQPILFWPLLGLIIPYSWQLFKKGKYDIRFLMLCWVIALCVCEVLGIVAGRGWTGAWIVVYASFYAILYLAGSFWFSDAPSVGQKPFYAIGALGIFGLSFMLSFKFPWQFLGRGSFSSWNNLPPVTALFDTLLTLGLIGSAVYLFLLSMRKKLLLKSLFGAMPVVAIIGYYVSIDWANWILPTILFNLYLIVLGVGTVTSGIRKVHLGLVNAGMLMLTALIIARFFDFSMSFIIRGIAFIIIGIAFLAVNLILMRKREIVK